MLNGITPEKQHRAGSGGRKIPKANELFLRIHYTVVQIG